MTARPPFKGVNPAAAAIRNDNQAPDHVDLEGVPYVGPFASTTWILQYWYQLRNAVPMLSNIGAPVRAEAGPAYLFSTLFSSNNLDTEFHRRFALVPWMTYRRNFEPIDGYSSDCGWGCMLRSAQMMLAETFFRMETLAGSSVGSRAIRTRVLDLFADRPGAPFSIHAMSAHARKYGKRAGEWFEPTLTLLVVRDLLANWTSATTSPPHTTSVRALVARDGVLDASSILAGEEEIEGSANSGEDPLLHPGARDTKSFVLLLIPLRLGLRELNDKIYGDSLLRALRMPQSVGMIGGKPGHSLYFCGSQARRLVFLDPHTVQTMESNADLTTYQCSESRAIAVGDIDPSLALGFLVTSRSDFLDLKQRIEAIPGSAMFSFVTAVAGSPGSAPGGSFDELDDDELGDDDGNEEDEAMLVVSEEEGELVTETFEEEEEEEFTNVDTPPAKTMMVSPTPPPPSSTVSAPVSVSAPPPPAAATPAGQGRRDDFVFL